jgi:CubicO group peptidase (beta-lactamase class C family)
MTTNRRDLIAAGAAFVLPGKAAWPFKRHKAPSGCHGRAAYGGGPLRAQISAAEFDAAARAGTGRAGPLASDDLDNRLERAARGEKSLGFTAAIARSDRVLWTQTGATAGPSPSPLTFEWPGLAEACVATAVLQLAEEGKLTLETTIERWAPEVPTARWITVEDLLSHTSGLADPVQAGAAPTAAYCPGAGWTQAETDDRLLARILGAADGRSVHDALARRIVERLELKETTIPPDLAAGAITASSADVVRIWRAVLGGGLQGADMARRRFLRPHPLGPGGHGLRSGRRPLQPGGRLARRFPRPAGGLGGGGLFAPQARLRRGGPDRAGLGGGGDRPAAGGGPGRSRPCGPHRARAAGGSPRPTSPPETEGRGQADPGRARAPGAPPVVGPARRLSGG